MSTTRIKGYIAALTVYLPLEDADQVRNQIGWLANRINNSAEDLLDGILIDPAQFDTAPATGFVASGYIEFREESDLESCELEYDETGALVGIY